jgi:hypothetical protein
MSWIVPGVPIRTCSVILSLGDQDFGTANLDLMWVNWPMLSKTTWICRASSREGARQIA